MNTDRTQVWGRLISTSLCLCRIQSASILIWYPMFYMDVVAPENVFLWKEYPAALKHFRIQFVGCLYSRGCLPFHTYQWKMGQWPSWMVKIHFTRFTIFNQFLSSPSMYFFYRYHSMCFTNGPSMNQLYHIRFLISGGSHMPSPKGALWFMRKTNIPSLSELWIWFLWLFLPW